jgi:hypothetical protein
MLHHDPPYKSNEKRLKVPKMQISPRRKSPRAPTMALEQALERVLKVYDQERLHAAPIDAVAQALGFKNSSNGSAITTLASLRYFGLLERPKDGFLAVSKPVESYKYAPDEGMKKKILIEFLKTPPLYQELLEKYSIGLPSPATLKYELIQKGFLPQAVDAVLSAFLQSVVFAKYFEAGPMNIVVEVPSELSVDELREIQEIKQVEKQQKIESPIHLAAHLSAEMDQIPIRLSGGRKAWLNIPTPFYESDKARIKAQIDVLFADADD